MDLSSLIKNKKLNLKPCKTVVTDALGERYEIVNGERKKLSSGLPFVVDEKPDLQVAEIIPGLFLSSQDPTANIEILREHEIRHVLSVGVDSIAKFDEIDYHYCDLLDLPESDLSIAIEKSVKIVHDKRRENILVHCNAGVSRSPTIIISYLMVFEKMSYDDAYGKVKEARSCIKPNEGFVKQLKRLKYR